MAGQTDPLASGRAERVTKATTASRIRTNHEDTETTHEDAGTTKDARREPTSKFPRPIRVGWASSAEGSGPGCGVLFVRPSWSSWLRGFRLTPASRRAPADAHQPVIRSERLPQRSRKR